MKATIADIKVTYRQVELPDKCPNPKCGKDFTQMGSIPARDLMIWEYSDQGIPGFRHALNDSVTTDYEYLPTGGEYLIGATAVVCRACDTPLVEGTFDEVGKPPEEPGVHEPDGEEHEGH